jgi:hypothetical protein
MSLDSPFEDIVFYGLEIIRAMADFHVEHMHSNCNINNNNNNFMASVEMEIKFNLELNQPSFVTIDNNRNNNSSANQFSPFLSDIQECVPLLFHLLMSAQTPNLFILSQQSYR